MNPELVSFAPNVPLQLSLRETEGTILTGRFADQVFYQLSDGRGLVLDSATAAKLNLLGLQVGEPFSICKQWDGIPKHPMEWSVWFSPVAEKARAAAEQAEGSDLDLEEQLRLSIEREINRVCKKPPVQERLQPQTIRGTGTAGPAPQRERSILPVLPVPSRVPAHLKIPYNVAFREILQFVTRELKASGEQWTDQSRQDLVSTCFIAASKAGMLQVWEREG